MKTNYLTKQSKKCILTLSFLRTSLVEYKHLLCLFLHGIPVLQL